MKAFFLASLLVVAVSATLLQEHAVQFQAFKLLHGKSYLNQVEETKRFSIFRENLRAIEEHNALYEQGLVSYSKKISQFSDLTQEEFQAYLTLHPKPSLKNKNTIKYVKTGVAVPDSVDWRQKGHVSAVKNQGGCGSCWAFSLTGSVEGALARKTGKLIPLSEQQLIDCSTDENDGCDGGQLEQNFPYLRENGLQSEETYPYEESDGLCRYNASAVVAKPTGSVTIAGAEDVLLEAVATIGPVSVAINANSIGDYHTGVFHDNLCSPDGLNHGVLIVGYGSENGKDYWIVKNSWGKSWGDNGYLKMQRGVNECGISEDTTYLIIA